MAALTLVRSRRSPQSLKARFRWFQDWAIGPTQPQQLAGSPNVLLLYLGMDLSCHSLSQSPGFGQFRFKTPSSARGSFLGVPGAGFGDRCFGYFFLWGLFQSFRLGGINAPDP